MKCSIPADYHIEDIYKVYKKTSIANTGEYPVEYSIYHKILCDVHKMMMDKILLESKDILLPYIGSIRIKKKYPHSSKPFEERKKYIPKDWVASKKAGKWIYETNEHRGGYHYRFFWFKRLIPNIPYYTFKPARTNKRKLAFLLKNKPVIDYFE